MNELRELYQEVILDHTKKPRNFKEIPNPSCSKEGFNPLCGDHYTLFVNFDGDTISDIGFQGSGCAISKSSASMMTQIVKGKSKLDVQKLFDAFHKMVSGKPGEPIDEETLGKLAVFSGVCEFPMRVKCASLAWHALNAAISDGEETVSTE